MAKWFIKSMYSKVNYSLSLSLVVGQDFKKFVSPLVKHVRLHLIDAQDIMSVSWNGQCVLLWWWLGWKSGPGWNDVHSVDRCLGNCSHFLAGYGSLYVMCQGWKTVLTLHLCCWPNLSYVHFWHSIQLLLTVHVYMFCLECLYLHGTSVLLSKVSEEFGTIHTSHCTIIFSFFFRGHCKEVKIHVVKAHEIWVPYM